MCRLFGLIANKSVDIKFSMLEAYNSFKTQSKKNPDGWGIGYFEKNRPVVKKSGQEAFYSEEFNELSKEIRSDIVIAHVRYSTNDDSPNSSKNSHPFLYNSWIFAHNGTINKKRIIQLLREPYNENFTSDKIDSEIYFRFIMQNIDSSNNIKEAIKKTIYEINKDATGANFLMTDGNILYACRVGKPLHYLIRNPKEPFSGLGVETKTLYESKRLSSERAVIISTEKITNDENWIEIEDMTLLTITKNLDIAEVKL